MSKGYEDCGYFLKLKGVREQNSFRNTALWSFLIACFKI